MPDLPTSLPLPEPHRCGIFSILRFASLPSTSSHARVLHEKDRLNPPCAIVADQQTAGRGRHGRTWYSDAGALTATFCLTLPADAPAWTTLGPRVAVAACRAVGEFAPRCRIKWPNDLLIDDRKVAGLLVERLGTTLLVGIGVNIASAPRVEGDEALQPTALAKHVEGPPSSRDALLATICSELPPWLTTASDEQVASAWAGLDALYGRPIEVSGGPGGVLTGVAEGIDAAGRLLVRRGDGVVAADAGSVRLKGYRR